MFTVTNNLNWVFSEQVATHIDESIQNISKLYKFCICPIFCKYLWKFICDDIDHQTVLRAYRKKASPKNMPISV